MLLRVHDLEIDLDGQRVSRSGRPIALSLREYRLLELLARRRGRLVSSVLIWQHLHGDLTGYTPGRISSAVRTLRVKIDKGFDSALIVARWGSGYMLRADDELDGERGRAAHC
jgi:two-component system copper resistance phosphate regulon response regulator CusR